MHYFDYELRDAADREGVSVAILNNLFESIRLKRAHDADTEDKALASECTALLMEHKQIAAMKLYRSKKGCGLTEAKDYTDSLAKRIGK